MAAGANKGVAQVKLLGAKRGSGGALPNNKPPGVAAASPRCTLELQVVSALFIVLHTPLRCNQIEFVSRACIPSSIISYMAHTVSFSEHKRQVLINSHVALRHEGWKGKREQH